MEVGLVSWMNGSWTGWMDAGLVGLKLGWLVGG